MANPKHTLEAITEKLEGTGKGIVLVGEYKTKRTKTLFRHDDCGYEWLTTFDVVGRLGSGCPVCFRKSRKLPLEDIQQRLTDKNITMIGEYINSHHKMTFRHEECSHEWIAKPCDLLNGDHGCPKCAKHGFNPDKSAWSYIFERNGYIKYGITNNLEQRLKAHHRHGEIVVHHSEYHVVGITAKEWENNIKQLFGGRHASKEECPDGYTETLPISALSLILSE